MDIVLLSITVVSLLLALVMSVAAWRLCARGTRHARAARVAVRLSRRERDRQRWFPERDRHGRDSPHGAVGAAACLGVCVAAPHGRAPVLRLRYRRCDAADDAMVFSGGAHLDAGGQQPATWACRCRHDLVCRSAGRRVLDRVRRSDERPGRHRPADNGSPLELVSLRHERKGQRLAVTGLVRNPVAGTAVDKLTAVVFLFDQQGGFITSARADCRFSEARAGR